MWRPVPIPEPPPGFVAHSVVAAFGEYGPVVTWTRSGMAPRPDWIPSLQGYPVPAALQIAVADCLGCEPGAAIVGLNSGTLVAPRPDWGADFEGFARPESTYAIPVHRFRGSSEEKLLAASSTLAAAQAIWDRDSAGGLLERREDCLRAFAALQAIKYALPGCDESDGDVRAMWCSAPPECKDPYEVFALVRIRKFPEAVAVIVHTFQPALDEAALPRLLHAIANTARENYRMDILQPMVAGVYVRPL